jgi:hypothetical protein
MAELAGLDPDRVRHWLFARCVQASAREPELRPVAVRLAPSSEARRGGGRDISLRQVAKAESLVVCLDGASKPTIMR